MKPIKSPLAADANDEVSALITTLHETGKRLEELTAGEVDSVVDRDGRTFLLQHAQEQLRHIEAAKQMAILNALPAHIALLNTQGAIITVNEAWRKFSGFNVAHSPGYGTGLNYLAICERADEADAHHVAAGIRSVLAGEIQNFSIEYPSHTPQEQRWFLLIVTPLLTVTPLAGNPPKGAVIMHVNVTEQKRAESRIKRLNRVYAVLSQINALIVRGANRDELFREACRIAVEAGAFNMAWIGVIDPDTLDGKVAAWHGSKQDYVGSTRFTLRLDSPDSKQPASRTLRQLQPVVCNDIATDPSMIMFRDELLNLHYKSAGYFPLMVGGRPLGVVALFAGEVNVFDEEEIRLLVELTSDIAFAMDYIEKGEKLNYLAYYDVLTGLANRALFHERLQQGIVYATAQGGKLALVLVDIERFKTINDTLGGPAGNALLKELAARMSHYVRDVGQLARINADNFAFVVAEALSGGELAHLIEQRVKEIFGPTFRIANSELRVSAKFGIALFPDDGADADTLFKNAEAALKNAKLSGVRYMFYTQAMNERVAEKFTLENNLRQAFEKEEFVLHYQPKMNLDSGKLSSVEALLRWNDPRTGLVLPNQFIPILEETGLIHEVGRWVLHKAIEDYLRWRSAGLPVVRIAVNVSPLQLRNRNFIDDIKQAIAIDPHAAEGLELEITESLLMEDIQHSIASLHAIRAMGVTIAIDDFGTGFSSLSYLSKLPVDTLKIDRSFVLDMTVGPEGLALVSTIISLAHSLKLNVVAEGVETEEQSRLLRLLSCDEMQGFLFKHAVPCETFESNYLAPGKHLASAIHLESAIH